MFDFFKTTEHLPGRVKRMIKPQKSFQQKTKTAFLAVFDVVHPAPVHARAAHRNVFAKTLVACAALIAIFASMSVYADTANVTADNPLYPLKRFSENVQLAVSPAPEKADLQANFAERRVYEIADLATRKPTSTLLDKLDTDLDVAVNASLSDAQQAELQDGNLNRLCDKVYNVLRAPSTGEHDDSRSGLRIGVLRRFVNQCGPSIVDNESTSSTQASVPTSTPATVTVITTTTVDKGRLRTTPATGTRNTNNNSNRDGDAGKNSNEGNDWEIPAGLHRASSTPSNIRLRQLFQNLLH
jgi:hypothetical protein